MTHSPLATLLASAILAAPLFAQGTPPPGDVAPANARPRQGGLGGPPKLRPPGDPAQIERGKALYGVQCTFCHGADARGGEGGPNLARSEIVLNDMKGELIGPVIQNGRPSLGMPMFEITAAQTVDIVSFLHSVEAAGRDAARNALPNILVGDAQTGETYFKSRCSSCHSTTGDLKGIGSRIADPRVLQQTWLMPGRAGFGGGPAAATNVPPKTVTVTIDPAHVYAGTLERIDDFTVTLAEQGGVMRTFVRNGDKPKVVVHDPLQPHLDLLPTYTDRDIHNLTAYLASVK